MKDWKNLFHKKILERGEEYFDDGLVRQVQRTENGFRALVDGSDVYEVEIMLDGDNVQDMICTCPFADGGNYCKHMAAVLYEIEGGNMENDTQESLEERLNRKNKELEDTVSRMTEGELRSFVKRIARDNSDIKSLLLTMYLPQIDAHQIVNLKAEVDDIVRRYGGYRGFIDYGNAWGFTSDLESFLYDKVQALIKRKCHMQAFDLTNYVFKIIGTVDIDDSDGGTVQVANVCYEMWKDILDCCTEEEKKKLFSWFEEHRSKEYVVDYIEEYLEDFMMNEFHDRESLLKKLEMVDQDIAQAKSSTDCGRTWTTHYGYQNNILLRLELMKELDYTEEEIRQYRKKNWKFSAVRELEVKELLEKGNTQQAVAVLKESKRLDKEFPGLVSHYSEQLIKIYADESLQEEYKKELEFLLFSGGAFDMKYIQKYKDVCSEQEWLRQRTFLLKKMEGSPRRYELMEKEGLYEEMLKGIGQEVRHHNWVGRLDEYEKPLKSKFPEEVRDLYMEYVKKSAAGVADRKRYQELVGYLKKIRKYPNGKDLAAEIAKEWRALYYRRSAMMDEMRKAGF